MSRCLLILLAVLCACAAGGVAAGPRARVSATTGDVAGTVKERNGRAVANAIVRVTFGPVLAETRTAADGKYLLADLPPGTYELRALKPGYVPVHKGNVSVSEGQTTTVSFVTEWADRFTGGAEVLVQDPARQPLPDAQVDLTLAGVFVARARTDAAGTVVFPGLPPAVYGVAVRRAGFFPAGGSVNVRPGGVSGVTVRLQRNANEVGHLGGQVRNVEGSVIPNALVKILAGQTLSQTRSAANGEYALNNLIPGLSYTIEVSAATYQTQVISNLRIVENQRTVRDVVLLKTAATKGSITGMVRDGNNQAVPFATVTITAGPATAVGLSAIAGEDGRYRLTDLEPATGYAVVAEQDGFLPVGRSGLGVTAGRSTVVDVVLAQQTTQPGSIVGAVRETGSGVPVADVAVEILSGPSAGRAATTDAAGAYRLDGVAPDDAYTVRFTKAAYAAHIRSDVEVRSGFETSLDVQLVPRPVPAGIISGRVRAETGEAIAGAKVSVFQGPTSPLQVLSAQDGSYALSGLRPGRYSVRVEKAGFIKQERRRIDLADGQTFSLNFALKTSNQVGGITGRVVNLTQQPVKNAFVRVLEGPFIPTPVRTDESGEFRFEDLPAGTYTLEASANGLRTTRQPNVSVSPRRPTSVFIQMLP